MKLVDILARELKTWPKGARWILYDGANGCYADMRDECIALDIDCSESDGNPTDAVYEESWQMAVYALKAEKVIEWAGEGLPPVGVVCEYKPYHHDEWYQVEIIAHFRNKAMVAAFIPAVGVDRMVYQAIAECFRPIRTQEQIAAAERAKECDKMFGIMCAVEREGNRSDMAEALYDAGYRKIMADAEEVKA